MQLKLFKNGIKLKHSNQSGDQTSN